MKIHKMLDKICIMSITVILLTQPVSASLTNKQNELNQNKAEISDYKRELQETTNKKNSVEEEIQIIDQKLMKIESELSETEKKLSEKKALVKDKEVELSELEVQLAEKEADRDAHYEDTKDRMVKMYKNKKKGYVQLIFSSDNLTQALNRAEYIKRISKRDEFVMEELKEVVQEVSEKKQAVEETKTVLEKEKTVVQETLTKQQSLQKSVESSRSQKSALVEQLKQTEEGIEKKIDLLEAESKKIEEEIKKLTAQSSLGKYMGGDLIWPVPGHYRLSSQYNPRENPISGKQEFHTGIDIPAPYGKNVVAAGDGTIIYSGVRGGYGNTVMIDHGGGIVTLYGHNSSLVVSVGQKVTKGQTIAKIGSTGYSTGNHCHFEVRKNGTHTNPWNYLED